MSVSITFTVAGGKEAAQLKERIRQEATDKGQSMSEWIVDAIAEHLRRQSA
jgi:6,7-dimethyl-8-ribityllumazine synthase